MWCSKCQNEMIDCTCSDKDERLKAISESGFFAVRYCTVCNKHYASCKCSEPKWALGTIKQGIK